MIQERQLLVTHLLPVNPLGGLTLPRNSVIRLTDSPAWLD